MAVPKFYEFFKVFLEAVQDGEIHVSKDVKAFLAKEMNLTVDDLNEMLPSGKQSRFDNRIMWARTYLDKAGLIETPGRGKYKITEEGRKALDSGEKIDLQYLAKFEKFKDFQSAASAAGGNATEQVIDKSPMEVLDSAFQQVEAALAGQLIDEVMKLTPGDFEKLVVELLLRMGYGNGIDEAGLVTPLSKDGGIDGIIKEDQLGFSNIYIQAKQWAQEQTVGTPELQKFVGALHGKTAQKGLFITTAKFSSGAVDFAKNLSGIKVVLIDGRALTKLMIKHCVGVAVVQTYEVKKVDSDFFSEEI